eukprot:TRINITY_DN2572_c0_g6_i1.p1 TRINITY_DN2572_c0_g6~~TRINITY_DN2572_c0_g6_i1.p1  ORF type:complete len:282 (-),score=16.48 TRINITY_DN2572_c0_g6_i1:436-1281(-)
MASQKDLPPLAHDYLENPDKICARYETVPWDCEGEDCKIQCDASCAQLVDHLHALSEVLRLAKEGTSLTPEGLCAVHERLFQGATNDGKPAERGRFRTVDVVAGSQSRLVSANVFARRGCPLVIPVGPASTTQMCTKQYIRSICHAQDWLYDNPEVGMSWLNHYFLDAYLSVMINFARNTRRVTTLLWAPLSNTRCVSASGRTIGPCVTRRALVSPAAVLAYSFSFDGVVRFPPPHRRQTTELSTAAAYRGPGNESRIDVYTSVMRAGNPQRHAHIWHLRW